MLCADKICDNDCTHGCNCIDGYVKKDDDCVPISECEIEDVVCGVNEEFTTCIDNCFEICESVRLDRPRVDCLPNASPDPCFEGCTCKTGYTRLNNDPRSPCVPSTECSTTYTNLNTFDFFEIVETADIPEHVDIFNPRTYNKFKETFADTVLGNSSLYVLHFDSVNYVESDGHSWFVKG